MEIDIIFKRYFFYGLGLLFIIIALFFTTALLISKSYSAEGSTIINRPKNDVYEYVKYLRNQENYSTWFNIEKDIHKNYKGVDGTVGSTLEWRGHELGKGKLTVTKMTKNSIEYDLIVNDKTSSKVYILFKEIKANQTSVTWKIDGNIPYPMNAFSKFLNLDQDFQQGVDNLKIVLEQ